MTRTRNQCAERLVLILTVASILLVLIYDRSSYREQIIQESVTLHTDWANIALGTVLSKNTLVDYFNWTNEQSCQRHYLAGDKKGYPVCLDPTTFVDSSCLVCSFGPSYDRHFEKEMKGHGCKVYNFDLASLENKVENRTTSDNFIGMKLPENISGITKNYSGKMSKTSEYIHRVLERLLTHGVDKENTINYLKLDIEGEEWAVISMMLESGLLSKIRQLSVKIHLRKEDLEYFQDLAGRIQNLENAGMIRFYSRETSCSDSGSNEIKSEEGNSFFPLKCLNMAWFHAIP